MRHADPVAARSSRLSIEAVVDRRSLDAFLDLPAILYRDDRNWVPPLRSTIAAQLSPAHPFNGYGCHQPFLARRAHRVVGRIVAAVNRRLIEKEGQTVGLFGYFECIDDQEAATALLTAASAWLHDRGCTVVRGPIDLSTHINCLFLIDGFDTPPAIRMPFNPPYYPGLVEAAGWQRVKAAFAYDFSLADPMHAIFARSHQRALAAGIRFRPIRVTGPGFEEDCRALHRVFVRSFADNWSATSRTEDEFLADARSMRSIADTALFPLAEHNGELVGFWMGLPDYNIALRHVGGRLGPIGLAKLLWHRRKIDQARVFAVGVLPEYQKAAYGLGLALIHVGFQGGLNRPKPYKRAELSWVWEDNMASRRLIEASGGRRYKTYAIYEKNL